VGPATLGFGALGAVFMLAGGAIMARNRQLARRERERRARRALARPWLE